MAAETAQPTKNSVPPAPDDEGVGLSATDSSMGISQLGVFSYTTPSTIGDMYSDPHKRQTKLHSSPGKRQFQTSPPRKGQTASNWGNTAIEFKRLFEGEPFLEPYKARREAAKRQGSPKILHEKSFKPSNPSKKEGGSGNYYGSFSKPIPNLPEGKYGQKGRKKKITNNAKRLIYTSPAPRGSYGTANTLISKREYPVLRAEYDSVHNAKLAEQRKHEASMKGRKPFVSMNGDKALPFDGSESTGASRVYTADEKVLPPKPDPTAGKTRKEVVAMKKTPKKWTPNNPNKSGHETTFTPFPKYSPNPTDPLELKRKLQAERRNPASYRARLVDKKLQDRKAFRPTSVPRKPPVSTIFNKGIYIVRKLC